MANEKNIGDGEYAADANNSANSLRGTFCENDADAPFVHPGASSTDPVLNVDQTVIRVQGEEWDIASGTVTLSPNATAYPRRDLVLARKGPTPSDPGSFDVLTGEPIDSETWATLTYDDPNDPDTPIIDGDTGVPVHPAANIPEIQPPPATGLRNEGPVLAMVYAPPGMADSTDVTDDYITDFTAEGVSFADVLRSGEAIEEIEAHDPTIEANVESADHLSAMELGSGTPLAVGADDLADGGSELRFIYVAGGETFFLWRRGIINDVTYAAETGLSSLVAEADGSGIFAVTGGRENDRSQRGSPILSVAGPTTVAIGIENETGSPVDATATFTFSIFNYDRSTVEF